MNWLKNFLKNNFLEEIKHNKNITHFLLKILNYKYLDLLIFFLFFLKIYYFLILNFSTDFPTHIKFAAKANNSEELYPPYFMYFFLVNLLSGFTSNLSLMYKAGALILSLSTVGKYIVSKHFINQYILKRYIKFRRGVLFFLALGLLFCFAMPDIYSFFILKFMYLGRIPSTVWHNSTMILMFPFAIMLFQQQLKLSKLKNLKIFDKEILIVTGLIILNLCIKPAFLIVFFPVSFFMILYNFKKDNFKDTFVKLVPLFIGSLVLLIQYVIIFYLSLGSFKEEENSIVVGIPFEFLRNFVPYWYIPIGLLISYIFPLATVFCYKEILKFQPFKHALAYSFLGLLISIFIIEDGSRRFDGNFTWQNIICMYLLILSTAVFLAKKLWTKERYSNKMIFLGILFIIHVLSGVLYLFKIYYTKSYF